MQMRWTLAALLLVALACGCATGARMRIEILGFEGCPNTPIVRANVDQALARLRIQADVQYVDEAALPETDQRRSWPAPTILVDGRDLFGAEPSSSKAMSCRLYPGGTPSVDVIAQALERRAR
jgi:hypothetical protein